MRLLYISNIFIHHQKPLADALYSKLGQGNYYFVETQVMQDEQKQLGYQQFYEPYVIQYNDETKVEIERMIADFDVVICGEAPISLVAKRYKTNKLTIRDDESRYKGVIKYLKWPIYTKASLIYNKGYLLCASAFGPVDYWLSGMKRNKIFKWGYFPETFHYDIEKVFERKEKYRSKHQLDVSILWAGRLIGWKHPESTITLARELKNKGFIFNINIIGTGPLENHIRKMIKKYNLENEVCLIGAVSSDKVRNYMLDSDICMITSDRREGWGAVVNESMNSGCAVVACKNIGAVPSLIEDGISGLTFLDCDWARMKEHIIHLIMNPSERKRIGEMAYHRIVDTWNANVAANNLLKLINSIQEGYDNPVIEGPCSPAPIQLRKSKYGFRALKK